MIVHLFICWGGTSHSLQLHRTPPLFQFLVCPKGLVSVWILNPPENCEEILASISLDLLSFLCAGTQATNNDITNLSKMRSTH